MITQSERLIGQLQRKNAEAALEAQVMQYTHDILCHELEEVTGRSATSWALEARMKARKQIQEEDNG